jgi:hypothetical protein
MNKCFLNTLHMSSIQRLRKILVEAKVGQFFLTSILKCPFYPDLLPVSSSPCIVIFNLAKNLLQNVLQKNSNNSFFQIVPLTDVQILSIVYPNFAQLFSYYWFSNLPPYTFLNSFDEFLSFES